MQGVRSETQALREERTTLKSEKQHLNEKLAEHEEHLEKLEARFTTEFENLAQRIFDEKSEKFTKQNKTQLSELLTPLKEKLDSFEKEVRENHEKSIEARTQLQEHIRTLTDLNQQMHQDARDLVDALEGQSKTQGDWGEMILERILEETGLKEGREYYVQETITTEDGQRARPDVVVKLPDERCLVIDAKVSIKAYRQCISADDEEARKKAIADHLRSVRNHIDGLSGKNYEDLHGVDSPDFVLMFIPVEPAFAIALQEDEELYNYAFGKNIVLVSPTTLLATMATVSNLWQHERRTRNAQEIAQRGGRLYDKFVLFAEALTEVGEQLDRARSSYDTAMNRLIDGKGNLARQAEMLRELGADTTKELPPALKDAVNARQQ